MLTFTYQCVVKGVSRSGGENYWQGLVAVDTEGWVVWYWANQQLFAWDFLPAREGYGAVVQNHRT